MRRPVGLSNRADRRRSGLFWGACGVLAFSFSLPATQMALEGFSPAFIAFGRAAGAGIAATAYLLARQAPWPSKSDMALLLLVAAGVVVGFPLLSSLAMESIPAGHGAIIAGVLPIFTALMAVGRGERPGRLFWMGAILGLVSVALFALAQEAGRISTGHLLILAAALAAATGYSAGATAARTMPSSHVICWALVLTLPLSVAGTLISAPTSFGTAPPLAWFGLGYLTLVSMFLGFFSWYRGLAEGGTARVGQLQLAQPLLTLGWAVLLLGEAIDGRGLVAACAVIFSIWLTLQSPREVANAKPVSCAGMND